MNKIELLKRDLFNKFDSSVIKIRKKIGEEMTENEKKIILKKIAMIIVLFQVDSLYKNITSKSGILSVLQLFGIDEKNGEKIRKFSEGGINIVTLTIIIFNYLRKEVKK